MPFPVTATVCAPLWAHVSVNAPAAAATASLKVTVRFVVRATSVAPFAGVTVWTAGAPSPGSPNWLLRGMGVPATKSDALLSVSIAPLAAALCGRSSS